MSLGEKIGFLLCAIILLLVYLASADEMWYRWSKVEAINEATNTLKYNGRWELGASFPVWKACVENIKTEYRAYLTVPGMHLSNLDLKGVLGRYIQYYDNGGSSLVSSGCFPNNEDPNIGIIKK